MNAKTLPIAITPGDPCGIGPEIVARAWLEQPQLTRGCFVAGDAGVMRRALALLNWLVKWCRPICRRRASMRCCARTASLRLLIMMQYD